jgi:hypothetical protein
MDLKTFITETLVGIVEGVAEAQTRIAEHHRTAAVALLDRPANEANRPNPNFKSVSFDVAVTSAQEETTETRGEGKVRVYVINAAIDSKDVSSNKSSLASRVQFSVPLHLPTMHSSVASDESKQVSDRGSRAIADFRADSARTVA